jgi:hypothetical protein
MNINRNNYEMYFLLYVDNELSATERNAVEKFVEENIDLGPELQLLRETTLPGEEIVYGAKQDLYKIEAKLDPLQEKMMLYMDHEMDLLTAKALEAELAMDDAAKQEWAILQHTRLDANEKIVFESKHLLYRHEKGRVITLRPWKIAIAAAFIGAGIFIGISFFSKDKQDPSIAANHKTPEPAKSSITIKTGGTTVKPEINPAQAKGTPEERQLPVTVQEKNNIPGKKKSTPAPRQQDKVKEQLVKKETNHLPKPYFENINKQQSNQTIASSVTDKKKEALQKNESLNELVKVIPVNRITETVTRVEYTSLTETPVSYAKNTLLQDTDVTPEINNDRILYMNQEKISRSKISGFFRKVKRVIERNTKVKTGNGIKIAGFEFAVR